MEETGWAREIGRFAGSGRRGEQLRAMDAAERRHWKGDYLDPL